MQCNIAIYLDVYCYLSPGLPCPCPVALQCVALQRVALQCVALQCVALQCVAVCCSVLGGVWRGGLNMWLSLFT